MSSTEDVAATAAEVLRAVLAEIADDGSELTAPTQRRIEGAALKLNAVAAMSTDGAGCYGCDTDS